MSLKDTQKIFVQDILSQDKNKPCRGHYSSPHQFSSEELIGVYRNNFYLSLTEALAQTFLKTVEFVGRDFFDYLCKDYIFQHPLMEGSLDSFADSFPRYIKEHEKTPDYLFDLTLLEWKMDQARMASNVEPMDELQFQKEFSKNKNFNLLLRPSSFLMTSQYPLIAMWNMKSQSQKIDLSKPKEAYFLIYRKNFEIFFKQIPQSEFVFLTNLQKKVGLVESHEQAVQEAGSFDILSCVQKNLDSAVFSSTLKSNS